MSKRSHSEQMRVPLAMAFQRYNPDLGLNRILKAPKNIHFQRCCSTTYINWNMFCSYQRLSKDQVEVFHSRPLPQTDHQSEAGDQLSYHRSTATTKVPYSKKVIFQTTMSGPTLVCRHLPWFTTHSSFLPIPHFNCLENLPRIRLYPETRLTRPSLSESTVFRSTVFRSTGPPNVIQEAVAEFKLHRSKSAALLSEHAAALHQRPLTSEELRTNEGPREEVREP